VADEVGLLEGGVELGRLGGLLGPAGGDGGQEGGSPGAGVGKASIRGTSHSAAVMGMRVARGRTMERWAARDESRAWWSVGTRKPPVVPDREERADFEERSHST
jgi:hypothetical protein